MTEEEKQENTRRQLESVKKGLGDELVITGGLIDDEGKIICLSLWSKDIHVSSRMALDKKLMELEKDAESYEPFSPITPFNLDKEEE